MMADNLPDDLVLTPEQREAKELLKSLRWKEDMVITNYEGERVWLKPALDSNGKRHGITDCCLADDPCEWHRTLEGAQLQERTQ